MNNSFKSILTVICIKSCYVYAKPLKKKCDAAIAIQTIIKNEKSHEAFRFLWTNSVMEFMACKFGVVLCTENIQPHLRSQKSCPSCTLMLHTILERLFLASSKSN